ncbi:ketopantoate reductase family protein [Collimonas silvisoli]|uniref:ketopantoate reductase family protein n=1 Tax=Collimonas silvisoli TaxID=2825884 RepID=UPI001B8C544D|nr:2-dehydropantoate 2-reductase [Collimonas silvisoli]
MIVGAGAMGCLFGARLAQAGYELMLVDVWREHIDAINSAGLKIETEQGEQTVKINAGTADAIDFRPDLVIVFTKTLHTAAALDSVCHLFDDRTCLLTLQNGLGNVDTAAEFIPIERVMHGVTNYPSDLQGPGRVSSKGSGYVKIYGADGQLRRENQLIAEAFSKAGFNCVLDPDVERAIWEKVAFNAALNSLTAVTGMTVGEVGASASGPLLAQRIVAETGLVARSKNIAMDEDAVWQSVGKAFAEHADHKPSMLQDVIHRRKTEIGAINGAIAELALESGIEVPVTETLYHLVRMIEQKLEH